MSSPQPIQNAILSAWNATLARRGPSPALFSDCGEVLRSFADIETEAMEWAGALAIVHEEAPGGVVAVQTGNRAEWLALMLACWRLELVPLPLGRHIEAAERSMALEACGASALISVSEDDRLQQTRLPYSRPAWQEPRPEFLKLTSGTTSAPRAIRFRAEHLLADCRQVCQSMGIGAGDLNYGVIPLSHSYGFTNLFTPLLCLGVPLVLSADPLPHAILDGLARTKATVFPGMPVFFDKLASLAELGNRHSLPHLRLCISAGAPLPPAVAERFTSQFGLRVHTFYGASECGGIAYDARGAESGGYSEGFVGTPVAGVRIDPQADGTISVESAAVGDGYWPQAGKEDAVLSGGRFVPADIVQFAQDGMFLAGRAADVINVAGRKLNPLEVEAQLLRFPGVRQAVVFGVSSRLRNEEPIACVAGSFDAHALLRFARSTLSSWQTPKDIWAVAEIPVNERGKVSRRELAKRYAEVRRSGKSC